MFMSKKQLDDSSNSSSTGWWQKLRELVVKKPAESSIVNSNSQSAPELRKQVDIVKIQKTNSHTEIPKGEVSDLLKGMGGSIKGSLFDSMTFSRNFFDEEESVFTSPSRVKKKIAVKKAAVKKGPIIEEVFSSDDEEEVNLSGDFSEES